MLANLARCCILQSMTKVYWQIPDFVPDYPGFYTFYRARSISQKCIFKGRQRAVRQDRRLSQQGRVGMTIVIVKLHGLAFVLKKPVF